MTRVVLFATVFIGASALPSVSWLPSLSTVTAQFPSALTQLAEVLPGRSESSNAPVYRTEAVERGDIVTTLQAAGTLNALVVVEVGSQISGVVKELLVDFNSKVEKGQVIARVEPEMYEAKLAQAQAELEMVATQVPVQQAQIERARAELEAAEAKHAAGKAETLRADIALSDAAQEMERKRPLAQRNVIAVGEWQRIQSAHKSAEAEAAAAQAEENSRAAGVRAAQAALNQSEALLANLLAQVPQKQAVLRQAQIDFERTYIRAPVTGIVVSRAVSGGQTLAAGLQTPTLFTIAQDLTQMQVEASVVEADISRFAVGQPVTFTVDAYPERVFAGRVKQIRKAPQLIQNVVTYVAVIAADNPDELLLPGMTANLQVVTDRREGVLKVPNAALRFRPASEGADDLPGTRAAPSEKTGDGGTNRGMAGRVFVPGPGGEPRLVPLGLGITDGQMTEIVAGDLEGGQPVIVGEAAAPGRGDASSVLIRFRLR